MSERCEPPEGWRERDGWHWLTECNPVLWIAERQEWEWGEDDWVTPDAAYRYGYRYLSPVATPAEVAALRAEVARLREALEQAGAAMDALHPDAAGDMSDGDYARLWNATRDSVAAALAQQEAGDAT